MAKLPHDLTFSEKDVLVVSDPQCTDAMLNAVILLAEAFREVTFHFRPHPHEVLTAEHKAKIVAHQNIVIQDFQINITEVLMAVKYVIGENSTVLYEALSEGCRSGKLYFDGLNPIYLHEDDRGSFWEINNLESFKSFLNGKEEKVKKSIYSPFDKELFMKQIKR